MTPYPIFSTRDLWLATTLVTLKFSLLGMDLQQEGVKARMIGYFKFEQTPELEDAKRKYMQGALLVEPRSFVLSMQQLKAEVTNAQMSPLG